MEVSYKLEGDKLLLDLKAEAQLDKDQDGVPSIKASSLNHIEISALELADELIKLDSVLVMIKEKLGIK